MLYSNVLCQATLLFAGEGAKITLQVSRYFNSSSLLIFLVTKDMMVERFF